MTVAPIYNYKKQKKREPTSNCYDYMGERSKAFRKAW